jgi:hypothetical protein
MKFDPSPEGQKTASFIMSAIVEGERDRRNQVPSHHDKDGTPVYRVLLGGLRWRSDGKGLCCYRARDGVLSTGKIGTVRATSYREWAVGKDAKNRWGVVLHDNRKGSPHIIASDLRTLGEAKSIATHHARRMPWIEGAPW